MPNGKSREKGKRGELDLVHRLGGSARRTGHSYIATPVDLFYDLSLCFYPEKLSPQKLQGITTWLEKHSNGSVIDVN